MLYAVVYAVASLLIDGSEIAYEPDTNVCRYLTDETESRVRGPLLVVAAVATIWAAAGGFVVIYVGARTIADRALRTTWTATVAVVAALLALWVLPAVSFHDALAAWVILLIIAVLAGLTLIVGGIVGISVSASRDRRRPTMQPAATSGRLTWLLAPAVFIASVLVGIVVLYAGPLHPVVEASVC